MSQIIVEQQFYYNAKMTSNKHFPNTIMEIYANCDANLEKFLPAAGGKAHFTQNIFAVAKVFINSAPVIILDTELQVKLDIFLYFHIQRLKIL